MDRKNLVLGIYEKALPINYDWDAKLKTAQTLGFHFVEMSIDESDARLERLDWNAQQKRIFREQITTHNIRVPSICLSAHRRFPFGSHDPAIRQTASEIMKKAIHLADALGIRVIQLAGYDVYYEQNDAETRSYFFKGLKAALAYAERFQVMLAIETMDTPFMNAITTFLQYKQQLPSPWFCLYPDLGNLSAWGVDIDKELEIGFPHIVAIHLKDTYAVSATSPGQFRNVAFGEGCVDFQRHFRTLKQLNYQGPFLIEMWTETSENPLNELHNAREWILQQMEESGFLITNTNGET